MLFIDINARDILLKKMILLTNRQQGKFPLIELGAQ